MNRRNFFRMLGGATVAAVAAPVFALLPEPAPLRMGKMGAYDGFKIIEGISPKRTWSGGAAQLQNLPRRDGKLTENIAQGAAAPAYEFRADTDTGWYIDDEHLKFVNCGHTSLACECNNFRRDCDGFQISAGGSRYLK